MNLIVSSSQNKIRSSLNSLYERIFPNKNEEKEEADIVYHEIPLKNYYDLIYTAKVYMGRPQ